MYYYLLKKIPSVSPLAHMVQRRLVFFYNYINCCNHTWETCIPQKKHDSMGCLFMLLRATFAFEEYANSQDRESNIYSKSPAKSDHSPNWLALIFILKHLRTLVCSSTMDSWKAISPSFNTILLRVMCWKAQFVQNTLQIVTAACW